MLKERFAKLIDVKSIISLMMAIVFCYLAIIGVIAAELFMTVFATVIAFYYGTQYQKKQQNTTTE